MYKSSRAFDANERVQRYRKSVSAVHENILLFKGFLGPTLKDNDALQSVGMRAARAAGVIVDSAGKLRCPPGTPNANQFTDMQMSNCLVPSAETLATQAANAVQRFVDGFRFKKGRLAKHKVDQKPANLGIPDADGSNVPVGAFDDSLGITNDADAVDALANGADLSQIPDEFLMNAIFKNVIGMYSENGRFKEAGYGGGVHGMARFIDTQTGQMIGVKYTGFTPVSELAAEVLSASVLEEFGYPASSMRVVRNRDGGIGIVTELIHNKYEGEISVGYDYINREAGKDASVDSMIHAFMLDLVILNNDRHGGNYLKVDDGEKVVIAPIDHGNAIFGKQAVIFDKDGTMNMQAARTQTDNLLFETINSFFERYALPNKKKDREELIQALEKSLADIREIDADALGAKLKQILKDIGDRYSADPEIDGSEGLSRSEVETFEQMANGRMDWQGNPMVSDVDALVNRIKELQSKSATEVADALFPNPDYTPQDPVSQLDSFALDLDIPTPDLADGEILSEFGEDIAGVNPFALDAEGAPLVSAREAEGLVAVTFDPEQFNIDAAEAFDSFVAEYRPSQLGDLTESDIDAIEKKMGLVPTEKTTAQKIDDAIAYMLNEKNGQRDIYVKMLDAETDPAKIRAIKKRIDEFDETVAKLKTPDGAQELRKIMIKNYAQVLQGIDDMQKKYPMLRGKFSLGIETPEFAIARGGYAGRRITEDGRIYMLTEMSPVMLFTDSTIGADNLEDGDILPSGVRVKGTDSNQLTIAVHEALHLVHYDQTARNLGFEIGAGSPPMLDQLLSAGPNIGDTYLGLVFAKNEGIDPATPIEELKKMERVRSGQKYNDYPKRFASFVNYQAIHVKSINAEDSVSVLQDLLMEGSHFDGVGAKQSLFRNLLSSMQSGRWGGNFKRPDGMETSDDVKKALSDALGQDFDSFVKELQDAVSAQFGFDFVTRSTGGVDPSEVLGVLGQASTYGSAILNESVAEAGTLNYLLENFNGSRVIDEVKINQIKDLLEKVLPTSAEKGTTKKITTQAQQLIDKLYEAIEKLPEPEWNFEDIF